MRSEKDKLAQQEAIAGLRGHSGLHALCDFMRDAFVQAKHKAWLNAIEQGDLELIALRSVEYRTAKVLVDLFAAQPRATAQTLEEHADKKEDR